MLMTQMEWNTFVVELANPLAWPITVLLLSLIFRHHLLVLVEKATEADEWEFNFGKRFSWKIR
jgi:hypothetical protein